MPKTPITSQRLPLLDGRQHVTSLAAIVIGKVWQAQGCLEVVERATKARQQVAPETLVVAVEKLLAQPPVQAAP